MAANHPLKKEWDKAGGKLARKCRICGVEFKPERWGITLCDSELCKKVSFTISHTLASIKRFHASSKEAKDVDAYKILMSEAKRKKISLNLEGSKK